MKLKKEGHRLKVEWLIFLNELLNRNSGIYISDSPLGVNSKKEYENKSVLNIYT